MLNFRKVVYDHRRFATDLPIKFYKNRLKTVDLYSEQKNGHRQTERQTERQNEFYIYRDKPFSRNRHTYIHTHTHTHRQLKDS